MTNKEIAELTTQIVVATAGNNKEKISWTVLDLCELYKNMFDTIKEKDQEN